MTTPARRMEVLAAGFQDRVGASTAAAELRRVLDVGDRDLSIGELAGTEEFVDGAAVVLGGRIRESRLDEVQAILRRHGGVILTKVPERWVSPSHPLLRRDDGRAAG